MFIVTPEIRVPRHELQFTFARSSGPGGQNVNKVNSKAVLRWELGWNSSLPEGVRQRFRMRFESRLTTEGALVLSSDRFRDRTRNIEDCLDKLRLMLLEVARPPKARKATRPTRGSEKRRREAKSQRGEIKKQRGRVRS